MDINFQAIVVDTQFCLFCNEKTLSKGVYKGFSLFTFTEGKVLQIPPKSIQKAGSRFPLVIQVELTNTACHITLAKCTS